MTYGGRQSHGARRYLTALALECIICLDHGLRPMTVPHCVQLFRLLLHL